MPGRSRSPETPIHRTVRPAKDSMHDGTHMGAHGLLSRSGPWPIRDLSGDLAIPPLHQT
jgi:hypothetical protein